VQIDIDARMIGLRYPVEDGLVGDSGETLRALLPLLDRKPERAWQQRIEASVAEWWKLTEERAFAPAKPVNPELLFWHLSSRLPDASIITADSGTVANWFARNLKLRKGMMASVSGGLASMGNAVPYAIAAKLAYPERPVFALVGDGAIQMNGNAELLTLCRYYRQWKDPRFIVVVLNNGDLNLVTWEMRAWAGNPRYEASQSLPTFNYAAYAEQIGMRGIRVERPEDIETAWEEALSCDRPVVVDALTDPNIPPLPPHITLKQAKGFALSMLKGDPGRGNILQRAISQLVTPAEKR
jgi:pyruvate dehydrogenase (quinone)